MEIKNAQYTVFDGVKVGIRAEINGIISNVPMDENNIDYEEILKQFHPLLIRLQAKSKNQSHQVCRSYTLVNSCIDQGW